jgi:hypothetical protein
MKRILSESLELMMVAALACVTLLALAVLAFCRR